jgi:lysophospholipase L1-like esterase
MFERFRYMPEAESAWKKYQLDQHNIFNCGVGGDQICNILYRLVDLNVLSHITTNPRITILMAGANDIEKGNIDEMVNGMLQIIHHIKTRFPATKLQVIGMYPRKSDKYAESKVYERVLEYNGKLKEQCKVLNISYTYYGDDILTMDKTSIDPKCLVDNVHFSNYGYNRFAERLHNLILKN